MAKYAKTTLASSILNGTLDNDKYAIKEGLIYYKGKIFLVPHSKLKERIYFSLHDIPMASHPRFFKT